MQIDVHCHIKQNKNSPEDPHVLTLYAMDGTGRPPAHGYFSIGLHPAQLTKNWETEWETVKTLARAPQCLAIGECGLDNRLGFTEALQEEVFRYHIQLANLVHKPLIIHCVRRYSQCLHLLKAAEKPAVFHGFNRNSALAAQIISTGHYVSFGHALSYHTGVQETLRTLPVDKLFFETDDEEISIGTVYSCAANVLGISLEKLENEVESNFRHLFLPNEEG